MVLMVPVNLRKFFPSESMLNFFGWIEPGYQFPEGDYEFEDIVRTVDAFFKQELTREKLGSHMSMYMKLEQHPILRFVPLELKNPALILANQFAEKDVTAIPFKCRGGGYAGRNIGLIFSVLGCLSAHRSCSSVCVPSRMM